ncbi:hypothetical protein B296_00044486 [Ensete ventricosum]|uniref:Uncharacterized protein n=1 Tax=Ensete ventricosum TaxID=4639 RepID=A0A426Y8K5_ENSVE|nr:hypothetical protein B296_00044486 [Ensete ventricosum]
MEDFCLTFTGKGDEGYYARHMTNMSSCDLEAPLETRCDRPLLFTIRCSQHYCMVLADHMHNAGRVISVMDNKVEGFQKEITELKVGSRPEAIAAAEL